MTDPLHLLFLEIGRLQGQIAACQANLHRSTAEVDDLRQRAADLVRHAASLTLTTGSAGVPPASSPSWS